MKPAADYCFRHPLVKVCGMKEPGNIVDVARLAPSLMGFIFYRKSPRYAGDLDPEAVRSLPENIMPVGVFVDYGAEEIEAVCSRYGISTVQLHGSESPELCAQLRLDGFRVMKAFGIRNATDLEAAAPYVGKASMFLFDTKTPGHGGSGRKFDWKILADYPFRTPYLLSGGIGPGDTEDVAKALRSNTAMRGVDLNSGFEVSPGIKNIEKLTNFILSLNK